MRCPLTPQHGHEVAVSDDFGTVEGWRDGAFTAEYSTPLADGSGWRVGYEATDGIMAVRVRAICAAVG